jgi:hypothetical protein
MRREESPANPPSQDRGDSVNDNPGDGASGPGDFAYDRDSQVSVVGGEAEIDLEEKAARMAAGDEQADPAAGAPSVNPDLITEEPERQSGG